ncbi:hypothetical protein D3C87_1761030 [compost metagenome]
MAHGGKADIGAVAGNGGGDHHRDRVILEDSRRVSDPPGFGEALGEGLGEIVLDGMEGDELGAGALQALYLAIDMGVVDADGGKLDIRHGISVSYRSLRCPR